MKSLLILEPIVPAALASTNLQTSAVVPAGNLLTPNPKEVYDDLGGGYSRNLDIDLGSVQSIDTFFLGYLSGSDGSVFSVNSITGGAAAYTDLTINVGAVLVPASDVVQIERHIFYQLAAPVNARYIRIQLGTPSAANHFAGVLAVGKAWQSTWGHEWGAGRPMTDTSTVERLFGGGFGINPGVTAGGYQWTFGDLTDQETRYLFQLLRRVGKKGSLLVVEDPDTALVGLNERCHWGLNAKLDPYERLVPGATRYSLRIDDWG